MSKFYETVFVQKMQSSSLSLAIVLLGSIFLALMSQLAVHLPFTAIPFTMQTLAVFLLGGILGSWQGALSVLAYLVQGTAGLPVFAGGVVNPLWFCDPKAGYLVSFLFAAYLIGKVIEQSASATTCRLFLALTLGQLAIFAIGAGWLALFIGVEKAYLLGVAPFFFGAACKIVAGALILKGFILCKARQ